jgi:thymidylate synthase
MSDEREHAIRVYELLRDDEIPKLKARIKELELELAGGAHFVEGHTQVDSLEMYKREHVRVEELERQLADVTERLTDAKKLARQWEYDARDAEAIIDMLAEALRNIRDDPDNKGWYVDGEALQEIARAALDSLDSKKRTEWNPNHPSYDEMGQ